MSKFTVNQRIMLIKLCANEFLASLRMPREYTGYHLNGNTMNSLRSKGLVHVERLTPSGMDAIDADMKQQAEKRVHELIHEKRWTEYARENHDRIEAEIQKLTGDLKTDFFANPHESSWCFGIEHGRMMIKLHAGNKAYRVYIEAVLDDATDVVIHAEQVRMLMQVKAILDADIKAAERWIEEQPEPVLS